MTKDAITTNNLKRSSYSAIIRGLDKRRKQSDSFEKDDDDDNDDGNDNNNNNNNDNNNDNNNNYNDNNDHDQQQKIDSLTTKLEQVQEENLQLIIIFSK